MCKTRSDYLLALFDRIGELTRQLILPINRYYVEDGDVSWRTDNSHYKDYQKHIYQAWHFKDSEKKELRYLANKVSPDKLCMQSRMGETETQENYSSNCSKLNRIMPVNFNDLPSCKSKMQYLIDFNTSFFSLEEEKTFLEKYAMSSIQFRIGNCGACAALAANMLMELNEELLKHYLGIDFRKIILPTTAFQVVRLRHVDHSFILLNTKGLLINQNLCNQAKGNQYKNFNIMDKMHEVLIDPGTFLIDPWAFDKDIFSIQTSRYFRGKPDEFYKYNIYHYDIKKADELFSYLFPLADPEQVKKLSLNPPSFGNIFFVGTGHTQEWISRMHPTLFIFEPETLKFYIRESWFEKQEKQFNLEQKWNNLYSGVDSIIKPSNTKGIVIKDSEFNVEQYIKSRQENQLIYSFNSYDLFCDEFRDRIWLFIHINSRDFEKMKPEIYDLSSLFKNQGSIYNKSKYFILIEDIIKYITENGTNLPLETQKIKFVLDFFKRKIDKLAADVFMNNHLDQTKAPTYFKTLNIVLFYLYHYSKWEVIEKKLMTILIAEEKKELEKLF